jgi:hypothetical protein
MAVAFVQEFETEAGGDRTTTNYDHIFGRLNLQADPPSGLILHTAGFDEDGLVFRVFDVWESQEQARQFIDERLTPILAEGPVNPENAAPPNRQYFYELHNVATL